MNESDLRLVKKKLPLSSSTLKLNCPSAQSHQSEAISLPASPLLVGSSLTGSEPPEGKRIRQDSKPLMNKLEMQFWRERLEQRYPLAKPQAIRFKLGNGIWYKPDFVDFSIQPVTAWEVKGPHAFRGGFENLKVAASAYPFVRWILVWKESGEWRQQEVLP